MPDTSSHLEDLLAAHEGQIIAEWVADQTATLGDRADLIEPSELQENGKQFLKLLRASIRSSNLEDIHAPEWEPVLEMLSDICRARAVQGFTPSDTAMFVFALKKPLYANMQQTLANDPAALASYQWETSALLDKLGLLTMEIYQRSRDEIIIRQQNELMELSTPVLKLWDGVLAVPLIGTLDSMRTQVVMEALLQSIVETGSDMAIIDITGVPTVDTITAQHLLKTVAAARLMGADCIISGIRPQIAQTIVHLGMDLSTVTTKATLADAFRIALQRDGVVITRSQGKGL
jgi:rsbT co-antagonist protein RsbR